MNNSPFFWNLIIKSKKQKIGRKCFLLLFIWLFSCQLSIGKAKDESTIFNELSEKVERYALSDVSKARALLDSVRSSSIPPADSLRMEAQYLYWRAVINYEQGGGDSTLIYKINQINDLMESKGFSFERALLDYSLASIYYVDGDYAKSFMAALQALDQFEKLANKRLIVQTTMLLGNICSNIESFSMAKDYYYQALSLSKGEPLRECRIRMNIYTILGQTGDNLMAIDSLSAMIPSITQHRDTALLVILYLNLGSNYSRIKDKENLLACCDSITRLIPAINNDRLTFGLYQALGVYYMYNNEPEKALAYFYNAKKIALQSGKWGQLSYTYLGLSNLFEQMEVVDSAFVYLKLYKEVNSKKMEKTMLLDVYRTYISTALESAQKELTITEQKLELNHQSLIIIVVSSVGVILLITLFLIVVQQKKRIKEAENKDLEERLQRTQLVEQLQEERIEAQAREITSHALMLSNKNQVLQQIADVLKQLPKQQSEAREIGQIIKKNLNTDSAWDNFMLHFEQVHPDFFNKINALNKDLTENDLRLCAYFRLGIPLKQIAQILNISHGSILIQRYRLKKKLGLSEEQKLDDFIRSI